MSLTPADLARYSRHLSLREIGIAGQEKLKAAKVLVIGAGGLGSPAILYLAAAGVGTIGIVDFDKVDVSNLQRQVLFDTASVGQPKGEEATKRLRALNPDIKIIAHQVELRANNVRDIFKDYDIVLDGTDRFATRYLTNDACVILGKPLVSAAIHRFEGQALTYLPNHSPCYRCLFPEPPTDGLVPNCAEAGVLGVLPGVLGTIQATEAIKLITGIGSLLIGRLLTYDALEMRFEEFKFTRRDDCAVCGKRPTIKEPQDAPELCSVEVLETIRRLSAPQLQSSLSDSMLVLVDVREPHEFQAGHLPNAINIPVAQLAGRLNELPSSRIPVFICRSGTRSLAACAIASGAGVKSTAHLEGGLLAWASEVDNSFVVAMV
jgi:molybdopterin/thiamine biosynthesis adenylyltransferase/rhodanese-related sulfurtransferase